MNAHRLASLYRRIHNDLRNIDGLQPHEAFEELLKFLFYREALDETIPNQLDQPHLFVISELSASRKKQAAQIRSDFRRFLDQSHAWPSEIWRERKFNLSDAALLAVNDILKPVRFSDLTLDVRSTALREFLSPEMRKGLGIFLTPEDVVAFTVAVLDPPTDASVYDPACGSGSFLIEVVQRWFSKGAERAEIYGSDKSARMLLLAELNLGLNRMIAFHGRLADTLQPQDLYSSDSTWPRPGSFDFIFTNPPFGVTVTSESTVAEHYLTWNSDSNRRQPSEILFIEECMRLLKPNGRLGIVLPRSVISNSTLQYARSVLGNFGYVEGVALLPPETFLITGAQTTTCILFLRRYDGGFDAEVQHSIPVIEITNVGYDSTGRPRNGNQLHDAANALRSAITSKSRPASVRFLQSCRKADSLSHLADLLSEETKQEGTVELKELVEFASTGKTPGRAHYSDDGCFLIKVGNLTGQGINWTARERNFVPQLSKSAVRLRPGDIVLTSSAHSPKYIAKKVDIIDNFPEFIGGDVGAVGEVMILRPKKEVDPYRLMVFLRMPETARRIQSMIRGQTAHLMPSDLLRLRVPKAFFEGGHWSEALSSLLRREQQLSQELNMIAHTFNSTMATLSGSRLEEGLVCSSADSSAGSRGEA